MREIKFRAWNPSEDAMRYSVDFYNLRDFFGWVCLNDLQAEFTVMQYTGLKDENGVEIYEGDRIRWFNKEIGHVEWDNIFAGWIITDKIGSASLNAGGAENLEVIGNIYENPLDKG